MLNVLEGYDLASLGPRGSASVHLIAEAMRRAYADRARHVGDADFVADIPVARLTSKAYAAELCRTIHPLTASTSSPATFEWPSCAET